MVITLVSCWLAFIAFENGLSIDFNNWIDRQRESLEDKVSFSTMSLSLLKLIPAFILIVIVSIGFILNLPLKMLSSLLNILDVKR